MPLDRVPIVLNVDMIGRLRNDHLIIYGARTSRGLRKLVSRQNDATQLGIEFNWDLKADSDHHSFFTRNVPVLMLFTGLHDDYHRPSDDAEKINGDGLMQVSRLMFNVLVELAERAEPGQVSQPVPAGIDGGAKVARATAGAAPRPIGNSLGRARGRRGQGGRGQRLARFGGRKGGHAAGRSDREPGRQ